MRLALAPVVLSLAAALVASCETGRQSPTSPSALPSIGGVPPTSSEYWVTLADEAPAPPPVPAPSPAPAPPAAPAPVPPGAAWSPGPPPPAVPGAPVPTPPSTHERARVEVNPEPVPYSGAPITDTRSCRDLKHTWFYDQIVYAQTPVGITIQIRENFFDGRFVNRNTEKIWMAGGSTVVLKTRWCSGYARFHYAQTRFRFTDDEGGEFTVDGPWVRLLAP